jgi:hypothetical protein
LPWFAWRESRNPTARKGRTKRRSDVRQDPDIILVGEIRDMETAKIATEAAFQTTASRPEDWLHVSARRCLEKALLGLTTLEEVESSTMPEYSV